MQEKLVTVVVPVYKVEKYLDCCVESIVNQTYKNLEIILVDDGSPDACPKICDEWAKRDSRIRVIHKENQGLGMARNTGIDHAEGEYICFFDSDDYVDARTIEKAYDKAEQYDTDIVIYGLMDFDDKGNVLQTCTPKVCKEIFSGKEVLEEFLPDLIDGSFKNSCNKLLPFSAWSCLFSMKLVKRANWRFVSERAIISEDSYSLLKLYPHVGKICVLPESLYYHRRNNASLSRSFRSDRFEKTKYFVLKAFELTEECGYNVEIKNRVCGLFFNFTIDALKHIVSSDETLKNKLRFVREIVSDDFLRKCLRNCRYGRSQIAKKLFKNAILSRSTFIVYLLVYLKTAKSSS